MIMQVAPLLQQTSTKVDLYKDVIMCVNGLNHLEFRFSCFSGKEKISEGLTLNFQSSKYFG